MEFQMPQLQFEDESQISTSPFYSREFYPIPPPPLNSTPRKFLKPTASFDSSMALTAIVLLTALFCMGFFSIYIRRFSEDNSIDISLRRHRRRRISSSSSTIPVSNSNRGLDPVMIQSLPFFDYEENSKESIDCAVCLCEFLERESVKIIPFCKHVFHQECIDIWLSSHGSCPLCRSTQLFLLPSEKKETRVDVLDGGFELDQGRISTVEIEDTLFEERERDVSLGRIRRTSSSLSLGTGERIILQRSLSF